LPLSAPPCRSLSAVEKDLDRCSLFIFGLEIDVHHDATHVRGVLRDVRSCHCRSDNDALRWLADSVEVIERTQRASERLAGDRAFDRELLLCACWLHDVGLFTHSRDPYVTEGARLAARVLEPFGWPRERLQLCMDACEQHNAPRSRMAMGLEAELVRQSDLVDVTARLVNFGLDRRWLCGLFGDVQRDGLWRLIGSAVLSELRHRRRASRVSFSLTTHATGGANWLLGSRDTVTQLGAAPLRGRQGLGRPVFYDGKDPSDSRPQIETSMCS
jgi:hypothetical protein